MNETGKTNLALPFNPYAASFKKRNFDFILLLVHTRWTSDNDGTRTKES